LGATSSRDFWERVSQDNHISRDLVVINSLLATAYPYEASA
jgi:hypothetical protein